MQIVDNLVKMTFHGNWELNPVSSQKLFIEAHKSNYEVQKSFYDGICNCACGVREQVHK